MKAKDVALCGVLAAIVFVATYLIQIPITVTGGYLNFGDSVILLFALLFGRRVGGIVGGLGAALADLLGPYKVFAPGTLVIKGLEGFLCGTLGYKRSLKMKFVATIVGGVTMMIGYFLYEVSILGIAPAQAWAELMFFNSVQAISGIIIALALTKVLEKTVSDYLEAWK